MYVCPDRNYFHNLSRYTYLTNSLRLTTQLFQTYNIKMERLIFLYVFGLFSQNKYPEIKILVKGQKNIKISVGTNHGVESLNLES